MSVSWVCREAFRRCVGTVFRVFFGLAELLILAAKSRSALAAENLFLRKQLALYQERKVRPHRADDATRWLMAFLGRRCDWRNALCPSGKAA